MKDTVDIAVLGPIPHDHITTHEGDVVEKYGCALYTTAALSALVPSGSRIVPVTHVRKQDYEAITGLLSELPHVETGHIDATSDQGDVINLHYQDQNVRLERQTGFMNPIAPEDVDDLTDFDAFVCVPITDFELPLITLQHIKSKGNALVVFDAHGPTNTCTRSGRRDVKFWIERDLWLPYIDILKMNLDEAACCWFPGHFEQHELDDIGELPMEQLPALAEHCLDLGVMAVYVTLDERGCAVYFRDEAGAVHEEIVGRVPVDCVVDTTGCGDSFAAGLGFGYLKTRDFIRACEYGNAMGSQRCQGTELRVYLDVQATEQQIKRTYRR